MTLPGGQNVTLNAQEDTRCRGVRGVYSDFSTLKHKEAPVCPFVWSNIRLREQIWIILVNRP